MTRIRNLDLPATMPIEAVVAVVDSREQHPYTFDRIQQQTATLTTGDYSAAGMLDHIAIERKSLPDLIGVVGRDRERFEREIQRLLAFPVRAIVVEASWQDIDAGEWRGRVTPLQARESLLSWIVRGVPCVMAGSRGRATAMVESILIRSVTHQYRRMRELGRHIQQVADR